VNPDLRPHLHRATILFGAILAVASLFLVSGCGKKDETTTAGNYYTGPMRSNKSAMGGKGAPLDAK
jgi:hypothetical protein